MVNIMCVRVKLRIIFFFCIIDIWMRVGPKPYQSRYWGQVNVAHTLQKSKLPFITAGEQALIILPSLYNSIHCWHYHSTYIYSIIIPLYYSNILLFLFICKELWRRLVLLVLKKVLLRGYYTIQKKWWFYFFLIIKCHFLIGWYLYLKEFSYDEFKFKL